MKKHPVEDGPLGMTRAVDSWHAGCPKTSYILWKEFLIMTDNLRILNYLRSVPMKFISAHFDQIMLLPPDITEKIPKGHKKIYALDNPRCYKSKLGTK
jgi:hypothetical protein